MKFHTLTTHAVQERQPGRPRLDGAYVRLLIESTAKLHGLSPEDILGRSRLGPVARARHAVIRQLNLAGMSDLDIGEALGRDRSTVAYALGKMAEREKS